ncbi:MAG: bifunctional 4-hydroxy-3-methylbut-2-enyl diphosphate reductase/30S ribosomal protein S1 [Eubacteriales bacterium]
MEIILAKTAGYCFGVNNAIEAVEQAIKEYQSIHIYTLGPIIHNQQVIEQLSQKGVNSIDNFDDIDDGVIIIRSHGVGMEILNEAASLNLKVINATCPYVKSIQLKVKEYYEKGYQIIIIGSENHPEVKGINGWCNNRALVINHKNSVPNMKKYDKICVVAQTTITKELFHEVTEEIKKADNDAVVFNTICNATKERQKETEDIAKIVDLMIIVGGYHSSNTQKLLTISKKYCTNTMHIETKKDLDIFNYKPYRRIGISAGASTPHWIIKEVIDKMEKEIKEREIDEMNIKEDYEDSFKSFKNGNTVTGKVISVTKEEIYLNIGYKADGIIKKQNYTNDLLLDLIDIVKPDDEIEAVITNLNDGSGYVELSKLKIDQRNARQALENAYHEGAILEGVITKAIKGGLLVKLDVAEVFMPASHYHYKFIKDLEQLVGEKVKGRIIEFDNQKNKIIFSQKVLLEEERQMKKNQVEKEKNDFIHNLKEGQKLVGKVKTIMKYGVFAEIGPVDGFIHISDLSWNKVKHPSEVVKEGDRIETLITSIDKENHKVKLSMKILTENPWTAFRKKYDVKDKVKVQITKIVSFGAFAQIIPQIEGLIHISELSHDKVDKVEDVVKVGDEVETIIIGINNENQKISLSIKEALPPVVREIEANTTVYKEEGTATLGDLFGDMLKDIEK